MKNKLNESNSEDSSQFTSNDDNAQGSQAKFDPDKIKIIVNNKR